MCRAVLSTPAPILRKPAEPRRCVVAALVLVHVFGNLFCNSNALRLGDEDNTGLGVPLVDRHKADAHESSNCSKASPQIGSRAYSKNSTPESSLQSIVAVKPTGCLRNNELFFVGCKVVPSCKCGVLESCYSQRGDLTPYGEEGHGDVGVCGFHVFILVCLSLLVVVFMFLLMVCCRKSVLLETLCQCGGSSEKTANPAPKSEGRRRKPSRNSSPPPANYAPKEAVKVKIGPPLESQSTATSTATSTFTSTATSTLTG